VPHKSQPLALPKAPGEYSNFQFSPYSPYVEFLLLPRPSGTCAGDLRLTPCRHQAWSIYHQEIKVRTRYLKTCMNLGRLDGLELDLNRFDIYKRGMHEAWPKFSSLDTDTVRVMTMTNGSIGGAATPRIPSQHPSPIQAIPFAKEFIKDTYPNQSDGHLCRRTFSLCSRQYHCTSVYVRRLA